MRDINYKEVLRRRLERGPQHCLNAQTTLRDLLLINYAVPKDRLSPHIPSERFEIPEFETEYGKRAFLSVVPFVDEDFYFPKIFPKCKFRFYQTNHRAYVIDRATGEHAVWFFGTNLGSRLVAIPRSMWKIPWHYSTYSVNVKFDDGKGKYEKYSYQFRSDWCRGEIEIEDTGTPISDHRGFSGLDEMKLVLTHPVTGYFKRLDQQLGTYSIWHPEMKMTLGRPLHLYFSLYESMGIMSASEMEFPHSIFVCPKVNFEIYLPPRSLAHNEAA